MFEKDIFTNTIKSMTKEDGSDLNCRIQELFEFLDTKIRPEDTPAWLRKFPYVNGQLFTEQHTNVVFYKKVKKPNHRSGRANWLGQGKSRYFRFNVTSSC